MNLISDNTKQSLSAFWAARDQRERTMLAVAAAVVLLGLIYALLFDPALSGRERLNKNLPLLRQQVAQLQALAKEVASLTATSAAPVTAISKESIEAALARKGLKPQSVVLSGDVVKVQLAASSFSDTLNWLVEMQKTARLSVSEANIVALAQPDRIDATLTLRQPRE